MQELSKNYNFSESEKKWQSHWQKHNIYLWNKNEPRENNFVVDTPPPTVSGQLHIGHVYSYTQADFIVRFQRMIGKNIFYPIGFDDNGLPTERLVEKQQKIKASNTDRAEFIEICKQVVASEEEKFRELFKSIGLSVDWQLEYQTINPLSRKISQMSFLDLVAKEQVYRSEQPMLWDTVDQTALAQADIEDKEKTSMMNDIIFHTEDGEKLVIATTRPEMLPACVAVFFHPEDERYKHLIGKNAITPLFNAEVPLYPDELVQQGKGTGLVMCCTFGDLTDIIWWKKHKLALINIIDKQGRLSTISTEHEFANRLIGLKIADARVKIIEILKAEGLLVKQTEITHTVKCAERSGSPLEILTTPQWFVKTLDHKEALLKRSNEINWYPKSMKIRLDNWINSIAWDWCISRQRYFGVPLPVWYSRRSGEEGKILYATIDQLPADPLLDLPKGYARHEVHADMDVMDTWATSSVSPQLSSHAICENFSVDWERHKKSFPADLRPQAHEILRSWTFYTILKAHLHQDTLPWHNIMISGWCLASDKSKMSKSKGNIVSPEKLLQDYGADVIRYWASTSKLGADTAYSEDVMKNGKRLVNKLWNAAKFVSQHFDKLPSTEMTAKFSDVKQHIAHPLDRWLITKLAALSDDVYSAMSNYEYAHAIDLIEHFFWAIFCDNYLEISKTRTYNEQGDDSEGQVSAILTLYHSLKIILQLFAPFLPYITEELYSLYRTEDNISVHSRGGWVSLSEWYFYGENDREIQDLLAIINMIRAAKAARNLSIKAAIACLEIKGCTIAGSLNADLANVISAQEIKYVTVFSDVRDSQILQDAHIEISIVYRVV